jgi:hypothetical protein
MRYAGKIWAGPGVQRPAPGRLTKSLDSRAQRLGERLGDMVFYFIKQVKPSDT